ncbi:MAG: tetratricopeptide repeat protein, partial [Waterburya sp.]
KGNYEAAREKLEAGLQIAANSPEALFDLGNTYLKLSESEKAIESYEKAFALEETFWPALNNVGLVEYEEGDRQEAIARWQSVIQVDNKQAEPQLALAVALFTEGEVDKALEIGKAALKLDNRYADIKFLQDNLWGEQLIEDTRKFLNNPQIQEIVSNSKQRPVNEQLSPGSEPGLPSSP